MCGIFGVVSNKNVAREIRLGLYGLQHRGEQGGGIVLSKGKDYWVYKNRGLITEIFPEEVIEKAFGQAGIGHTRYSTIGDFREDQLFANLQPLQGEFQGEPFWLCHNGNLVELNPLRKEAEGRGYLFKTTSDSEVIVGLLSVSKKKDFIEALLDVLPRLKGAFSLLILYKNKVIGVRDRFGIRPLCLGRNESGFILASESCAFHTIRAHLLFDLHPGELIILDENGINRELGDRPFIWPNNPQLKICIFEFVYFARPDSIIDGQPVYFYRRKAGEFLAQDYPVEADIVIPVPDSGRYYDIGFSHVSGIPLEEGIFRNRYFATRTFLTDRQTNRAGLQQLKFRPLRKVVHGKRIVVTEDSIIRANVSPAIVSMLREEGATEVHLRVGSSPIRFPCQLGIDMPTKGELIASSLTVEEVRRHIQADSLFYLALEKMIGASGFKRENLCLGCFTGEYPIEIEHPI